MSDQLSPVFILSAPFSGASKAAAMLGRHSGVLALPELSLFIGGRIENLLEIGELGRGVTLDGLLRAMAQIKSGEQTSEAIMRARAELNARRAQPAMAVLEELVDEAEGKVLVTPDTQSPQRPLDLERLNHALPNSRWLHLIRHPYRHGVMFAKSLRERLYVPPDYLDHSSSPAIIDPQIPWLRCNENILSHIADRGESAYLRVDSDAFTSNQYETVSKVCGWLGLSADSSQIDGMRDVSQWPFWEYGPPEAPFGLEMEVYDDDQPQVDAPQLDRPLPWRRDKARFAPEVISLAEKFGYS